MKYWIDRFEGAYAVAEDEQKIMYNIRREELPKETKEGDLVIKTEEGYLIDAEATAKKREEIRRRMNHLFE